MQMKTLFISFLSCCLRVKKYILQTLKRESYPLFKILGLLLLFSHHMLVSESYVTDFFFSILISFAKRIALLKSRFFFFFVEI